MRRTSRFIIWTEVNLSVRLGFASSYEINKFICPWCETTFGPATINSLPVNCPIYAFKKLHFLHPVKYFFQERNSNKNRHIAYLGVLLLKLATQKNPKPVTRPHVDKFIRVTCDRKPRSKLSAEGLLARHRSFLHCKGYSPVA